MKNENDNRLDNLIALPHSNRIQWVAVGHTHMRTYNKTEAQIYGMLLHARKTGKFFTRKLAQFFNGHKALTYKSHSNNPLIISHLHTGETHDPSSTIHFHFAFGNIPTYISDQEMMTVFQDLWINKAKQSHKSIWLQKSWEENSSWLNYGHNENRIGKLLGLDIDSTYIPETR